MDDILINILLNTKVTREVVNTRITNPILKRKYPKRTFFISLRSYVDKFLKNGSELRMIGLAGLRGTGKTTLMWQLADYLLDNYHYPVYFFNVNEITAAGYNLNETLEVFQTEILKKRFNQITEPIIFLFDEIHDSPDWSKVIKVLYDEARTSFIVCTGSSALLLKYTADLARRIKIEKIYPFRFFEFITAKSYFKTNNTIYPMKNISSRLREILFFSQTANEFYERIEQSGREITEYYRKVKKNINKELDALVDEYIKYHNIPAFITLDEKSIINDMIKNLVTRVIYEDLIKISESGNFNPVLVQNLLIQLAISDEVNIESLSKKGIKKEDINLFLELMEKAELINILNPFGGAESKIWKNKKVFFMSPSIRNALLSIIYGHRIPTQFLGKFYEDLFVMYLRRILDINQVFFTKIDSKVSPDFVVETGDKPIFIEIGINKTTTKQLRNYDKRYGILISNKIEEPVISLDVIKIPLKTFLLL